jgi:hypothetical protein
MLCVLVARASVLKTTRAVSWCLETTAAAHSLMPCAVATDYTVVLKATRAMFQLALAQNRAKSSRSSQSVRLAQCTAMIFGSSDKALATLE